VFIIAFHSSTGSGVAAFATQGEMAMRRSSRMEPARDRIDRERARGNCAMGTPFARKVRVEPAGLIFWGPEEEKDSSDVIGRTNGPAMKRAR
jgi:hypothetical protein